MNKRFPGKVVLVAGGTGGLGRATTLAFLQEGATVIVPYRKQPEFDALKAAASDNASQLHGSVTDITDESSVRKLVDNILTNHGGLDVLVNAAGAFAGGAKLWEADAKVFDQMLAVNLKAGYVLARAAVPALLKQATGAIVNVSAKAAVDHPAGLAAYAASKAAALALFDSLAAELKGTGVRVNSLLPTIIDTAPNRAAMPNADFTKWPKPEEIARVILFLCSDEAKVIHGTALAV